MAKISNRSPTSAQKKRILVHLMRLDEDQRRLAFATFHHDTSNEARQAYVAARIRLNEAEELRRQALAGSESAFSQLLRIATPP